MFSIIRDRNHDQRNFDSAKPLTKCDARLLRRGSSGQHIVHKDDEVDWIAIPCPIVLRLNALVSGLSLRLAQFRLHGSCRMLKASRERIAKRLRKPARNFTGVIDATLDAPSQWHWHWNDDCVGACE